MVRRAQAVRPVALATTDPRAMRAPLATTVLPVDRVPFATTVRLGTIARHETTALLARIVRIVRPGTNTHSAMGVPFAKDVT